MGLERHLRNDLLHHLKCVNSPAGLILIIYILSYPKAVSDSMQKETGKKQTKRRKTRKINRQKISTLNKKNENRNTHIQHVEKHVEEDVYFDCAGDVGIPTRLKSDDL